MAKGYWIVHVTVTDAGNYPKYIAADGPVFEAWGAKFLVRGGDFEVLEVVAPKEVRAAVTKLANTASSLEDIAETDLESLFAAAFDPEAESARI